MTDQLDLEQKFRLKLMANEYLLRAALIRLMLLDLGFAHDAREWFDNLFGQFSASEKAYASDPQVISTLREEYLRLLERAEKFALRATSVPKPKSIRRHIFEWFQRG